MPLLFAATLFALTVPTALASSHPSASDGSAYAASPDSVAYAADVTSLDRILAALYDVISGPAGQERDWDRMRYLFLPEGLLVATAPQADGTHRHRAMSVDDYVATSGPWLLENGFYEVEIARRTEQFGATTHAWSTYEGRLTPDADPFLRGVNSIQVFWDGTRWWIVSVFWSPEHPGEMLPDQYLPTDE
ncbi:MAG: hypothetical protein AAF809_01750 [Bacteroidota bacterium]